MATYIEFNSNVDGKDIVALSRNRNVWSQLSDIIHVFVKEGYRVFGNIEYCDRKYEGEYRLIGPNEEFTMSVH